MVSEVLKSIGKINKWRAEPSDVYHQLIVSHLFTHSLTFSLFLVMASEKFTENSPRSTDVDIDVDLEQAQFVNPKPEVEEVTPLPAPASSSIPSKSKSRLTTTAFIIPIWIVLSSTVIIYNNYLYNTLNFKFPVFLVTWHLGFAVRV